MNDIPGLERGQCKKCGSESGNNWGQCRGTCPVLGSVYYTAAAAGHDYRACRELTCALCLGSVHRSQLTREQEETLVRGCARVPLYTRSQIELLVALQRPIVLDSFQLRTQQFLYDDGLVIGGPQYNVVWLNERGHSVVKAYRDGGWI